ncbi:unnamed protein product, partial [Ectocarpus fasciculatus]
VWSWQQVGGFGHLCVGCAGDAALFPAPGWVVLDAHQARALPCGGHPPASLGGGGRGHAD